MFTNCRTEYLLDVDADVASGECLSVRSKAKPAGNPRTAVSDLQFSARSTEY